METVYILGAARTPMGAMQGVLSSASASYLGGAAIAAAVVYTIVTCTTPATSPPSAASRASTLLSSSFVRPTRPTSHHLGSHSKHCSSRPRISGCKMPASRTSASEHGSAKCAIVVGTHWTSSSDGRPCRRSLCESIRWIGWKSIVYYLIIQVYFQINLKFKYFS